MARIMAPTRCPRCADPVADTASACAGCARPITLDLTARVPKKPQRPSRRPWRDGILLFGGAGGIAAASTSDHWWVAGGIMTAAAMMATIIHFGTRE